MSIFQGYSMRNLKCAKRLMTSFFRRMKEKKVRICKIICIVHVDIQQGTITGCSRCKSDKGIVVTGTFFVLASTRLSYMRLGS